MRTRLIVGALVVIGAISGYGKALQLVTNGKSVGKIILQPKASPSEQLAAQELTAYIKKISGATLPTQTAIAPDSIVLGTPNNLQGLPSGMKQRLAQCAKNDAFYIKTIGNKVYIVGKKPIGVLYGAYTLLEKMGVRWFYPGKLGENCPKLKTIQLAAIDDFQAPDMTERQTALGGSYNFRDGNMWCARQKMRTHARPAFRWFSGCSKDQAAFLNKACDFKSSRGGHLIFELAVPDKLFKKHPEYFTLKNGKRKFGNRLQRCVANPEVFKLVAEYGLNWCNADPNNIFSICGHDSMDSWCECEKCRKLGTVNGKFKVTNLYHRFFSKVAKYILKRNPNARIDIYFYINYGVAPDDKSIKYTGKNVRGLFCTCYPHARCYAHYFTDPKCKQNVKCLKNMKDVLKICPVLYTYEYVPSSKIRYAPIYKTTGRDIKDLAKLGIDGYRDSAVPVNGIVVRSQLKRDPGLPLYWQARWPSLYISAKKQWNTKLNTDKVMAEAYEKYYGKAAPAMKKYHALRLKLWNNAPGHAFYGGPARYAYCLTVPGAEEKLNAYLAQAEKAAAGNKLVMKRLALDKKFLKIFWKKDADKLKKLFSSEKQIVPCQTKEKITIDGSLSENAWVSARPTDDFLLLKKTQEPTQKNNFRLLYDKDNLYIGFVAMNDKAWGPEVALAKQRDSKKIFKDDHIELEIAPPGSTETFYHICINTKGVLYDSEMTGANIDLSHDSKAEIKVKKLADRFVYEIRLPVKPMKGSVGPGKTWRFYALRTSNNLQPPNNRETCSLDGNYPHRLMEFRPITFGKNLIRNGNFSVLAKYTRKTPEKIVGSPGKFPQSWGINSSYCKIAKAANGNTVTFRGGTIYTYLGGFAKPGKLTVTAEAKGKGQILAQFWLWTPGKKGQRLNSKRIKIKPTDLTADYKQYVFECDLAAKQAGYFYLYSKGELTVSNVNAVATEK